MPAEGITLRTRVCHNAQKDRLRVDFVYPDTALRRYVASSPTPRRLIAGATVV
jgi:hypothetical protein